MSRWVWLVPLFALGAIACSPSPDPVVSPGPTVAVAASPPVTAIPTHMSTPSTSPLPTVTPEVDVWPIGQSVTDTIGFFETVGWSFDAPVPADNGDSLHLGMFDELGLDSPFLGLAESGGVVTGLQISAPLPRETGLISAIAALVSDSPELAALAEQAEAGDKMDETIDVEGTPVRANVYELSEGEVRALLTVGVVGLPG